MANGADNLNNLATITDPNDDENIVCQDTSTMLIVCFVAIGLLLLINMVLCALLVWMHRRRRTVASRDIEIPVQNPKENKASGIKTFGESGTYRDKSTAENRYESMGEGTRMSKLPPNLPMNAAKPQIRSPPPRVTLKLQQINNITGKSANLRGKVDDDNSVNDATDRKSNHNYEEVRRNDTKGFMSTYEVPVDSTLTRDRAPTVPERRPMNRM